MYRDDSTLLDEHDRAVGAIQIADGLLARCFTASKQLASAEHRWRAVREIHDDYGEVWLQLDGARQLLASRGANTMGFDELREQVVLVLALHEDGVDMRPLEDARRAIAELRLAMPGADWKAIEARTRGLARGAKLVRGGQRAIAFAAVTLVFLLGAAAWNAFTTPTPVVNPRVAERLEMQKDLDGVVNERKDRIDQLSLLIGGRCDRENVVEFVKLLSMDGRWNDAHVYGVDYMRRCKDEDGQVRKWADYAKKKLDRLSKL